MSDNDNISGKTMDDEIFFADEENNEAGSSSKNGSWKIIISDDEIEVHNVTKMVLSNTVYKGKELQFLHAYSGEETIEVVRNNPDTALLLLDVVMEEDNTGLKIIRYIRETLNNYLIRIVIRTGQPGEAPEKNVIVDYDINDYKEKTELTSQKLFSTVIASLRSYDNLLVIDNNKRGIERILSASNYIFRLNTSVEFYSEILNQMKHLFLYGVSTEIPSISGFIALPEEEKYLVDQGIGRFEKYLYRDISDIISFDLADLSLNQFYFDDNKFIAHFVSILNHRFVVYGEKNAVISADEQNLFSLFCTNISSTYNKLCLTNEIENTQKEILFTLGEVVETRSNETGYHVKRVAAISELLALKYGLEEKDAEILKQASPMHDIGKVGIHDKILNKPGKLTADEFEIMKTHTTIGFDIFKNSKRQVLQAAAIIALQHHERFDGTGYPQKLKGNGIHIFGRITCLADVFDALCSDRVYKKAWELPQVLDFIKEQKGQIFDPDLVDIFFSNINEILGIRESMADVKSEN